MEIISTNGNYPLVFSVDSRQYQFVSTGLDTFFLSEIESSGFHGKGFGEKKLILNATPEQKANRYFCFRSFDSANLDVDEKSLITRFCELGLLSLDRTMTKHDDGTRVFMYFRICTTEEVLAFQQAGTVASALAYFLTF